MKKSQLALHEIWGGMSVNRLSAKGLGSMENGRSAKGSCACVFFRRTGSGVEKIKLICLQG